MAKKRIAVSAFYFWVLCIIPSLFHLSSFLFPTQLKQFTVRWCPVGSVWPWVCFPFRPYLSLCLISLIIFEPSLKWAFVGLIWTTYALNQQLSYLTAQMGAHISNAICTCLTHVAPTDVRMARVTLEVCFSLQKYFCGEAILLLGFCGRGVCFWALLVGAFLAWTEATGEEGAKLGSF